ncbi:MAG: TIGR03943 family protein [Burkholderiaceae bacterium]|nr:TIGR03943 family protein [Microbacteriaceae bacterium]
MSGSATRWQGLVLIAAVSASTLWLWMSGQLGLYVAPRHEAFVTIMAAIGLVASLLSAVAPAAHDHSAAAPRWNRLLAGTATGISAVVATTMLVLPPATLTSATATLRAINSTSQSSASAADVASAATSSTDAFSINDWASILRQTSDLAFYSDRNVTTIGFITADPEDPENMFYVSRFVITHCAIDAQAIGLPIYLENWGSTFEADQWIDVTGEFGTNRSRDSSQAIALLPDDITGIDQPTEPYLYA